MDMVPGVRALTVARGDVGPARSVWVARESTLIVATDVALVDLGRAVQEALDALGADAA